MRRGCILFLFAMLVAFSCHAQDRYRIEVLQVGSADAYDAAYDGLLDGLAREGLVKGINTDVTRTVLETRSDPSPWERITGWFRIRDMARAVVDSHPDLVVTLGNAATRSLGEKISDAGIPVLFSTVCEPTGGVETALPGVIIRPRPHDVMKTALMALPGLDEVGVIRSSDPEAVRFTDELTLQAKERGITVVSVEFAPGESMTRAAGRLLAQGVDAFIIPPDSLYQGNASKEARELIAAASGLRVPCISSILSIEKGALITLSPDYDNLGLLTAKQAREVLFKELNGGRVSVLYKSNLSYTMDLSVSHKLGFAVRARTDSLVFRN
jgi:ABC-type uncharacterized transport system substrate-binding protein